MQSSRSSSELMQVRTTLPWYREVNREQWRALYANFFGWVLDGFDFTILTFLIIDIQKSFRIDNAQSGAVGTITLLMRLVGGLLAGTAAGASAINCW
jgi:hypothetical protein